MDAGKSQPILSRRVFWLLVIVGTSWLGSGVYWLATDRWVLGAVFLACAMGMAIVIGTTVRQGRR